MGVGCLEASRGMGVSLHMHVHSHTHMYTYIEITNGCRHGGIHALSCLTCMWVGACVCAWCMGHPHTPTPNPIHPHITLLGGTPGISENSITLELIKIIQCCLKKFV